MQELIKQWGSGRSSGSGQEQTGGSSQGGKLPTQKTVSFKGARKWFQRQFSGQMSSGQDDEHAAVVAAATYAINIHESGPDPRTKIEEEDSRGRRAESGRRVSKSFTERFLRLKSDDEFDPADGTPSNTLEEKSFHPIQSKKKTPSSSFRDRLQLEEEEEIMKRPDITDAPNRPSLKPPPPPPPPLPPPPPRPRQPTKKFPAGFTRKDKGKQKMTAGGEEAESTGRRLQKTEAEADAWERAELAKIKEKYGTLNNTIVEWEDNNKKKSTRKLFKIEIETDKKKAKARASYGKDMENIRRIADAAKTQARDKQRMEEMKVKEKANEFRTGGGKPPAKRCSCF